MTASNMPGFTADKSLYTMSTLYYPAPNYLYVDKEQGVIAQLSISGNYLCELCHWYCSFFANRLECYVFCGRAGFCGPTLTETGWR
ncbi:MAG TPA: hypothetical protein VGM07_06510 [Stellaceae bacterium]